MIRLIGACLVSGAALFGAMAGAARLFDARAAEGGRELAVSLAPRDADTAARPLATCADVEFVRRRVRGRFFADVIADGEETACRIEVWPPEAFSKLFADGSADACRFDIEYAGGPGLAHDTSGCATTWLLQFGYREQLVSCLGLSAQRPRASVELRQGWPAEFDFSPPPGPSTLTVATGCPDPKGAHPPSLR